MKKFNLFTSIALLCGLALGTVTFSGCQKKKADGHLVLKLAHNLDLQHPVHKAMLHMKNKLTEKSDSTIDLQIFPSGQLGSERETIEQVQLGSLDMVKASCAHVESFIPEMGVFSVPYIFRNHDHYWKVLLGNIGNELLLSGENVGLRGLCYYDAGARSFYTKNKEIKTPEDLKGMKIRVMQSKTCLDMINALGANPTPISFGELYTSLQQGVVDGAENNPPSFYTARHYEVCKVFTLDEHTSIPDILLFSYNKWKTLPEKTRNIIQEAADESSVYERRLWKKMTEESLEKVQAHGVKIIRPDKGPFIEKVKPLHKSYSGSETGELIKRIKETN